MERARILGVAVGESKIDCHREVNLATAENVLEEGVLRFNLKLFEVEGTGLLRYLMLS